MNPEPDSTSDVPGDARILPHWALLALFALTACAVAWLQLGFSLGDSGMNNALSFAAVLVSSGVYWLWFVSRSRQRGAVRGVVFLAGLGGLVGALSAVRIDSWNGALIPRLRWAWVEPHTARLPIDVLDVGRSVDLSVTAATDFAGFLGPTRTGVVPGVSLAKDWTAVPPQLIWRVPCGAGWSGFALVNDVAITLEQRDGHQVAVARSMVDGAELWRRAQKGSYFSNLAGDGPRSTPLVHGGLVYTHDALGRLACLDGRDGRLLWEHDLRAMYGMTDELEAKIVGFGRSPSPLEHDGRIIIAAGGDPDGKGPGLVAFAARSGDLLWEGPPRQISHASPNVVTLAGRTQIVVTNQDTVSGHAPDTGALLWEHPWPGSTSGNASNSQPTPVGEDRVLLSKGYGQGSELLRLVPAPDGSLTVESVWASRRSLRTKFTNPVVLGDFAYALSESFLECVSLKTGQRIWRDGRYGHGQVLLVGQGQGAVLLVQTEEGELLMIEPSPDAENQVLGKIDALSHKSWNTIALSGDRVVVRNAVEAACYRLPLATR